MIEGDIVNAIRCVDKALQLESNCILERDAQLLKAVFKSKSSV